MHLNISHRVGEQRLVLTKRVFLPLHPLSIWIYMYLYVSTYIYIFLYISPGRLATPRGGNVYAPPTSGAPADLPTTASPNMGLYVSVWVYT